MNEDLLAVCFGNVFPKQLPKVLDTRRQEFSVTSFLLSPG
jgi:hypothetical protein